MKKNLMGMTLLLALLIALFPATTNAQSSEDNPVVNGSFETGDYTGWTLWETIGNPTYGTWGIASNGQTIIQGQQTYDFYDKKNVIQLSPGLPKTYTTTDGQYLAYLLTNWSEDHRMYQDVTIPENAKSLSWDMSYQNLFNHPFSGSHYLAVYLRDTSNTLLETLFITAPGASQIIPMTHYSRDISAYAEQTVRIDVQIINHDFGYMMNAGFDNFRISVEAPLPPSPPSDDNPPGWENGKKKGWDGDTPPGQAKKDK